MVTALRPPMTQILKNLEPLLNNGMGFLALDIDDKAYPTRVFLLLRIIEALLRRKTGDAHRSYLVKNVGVYATRLRLYLGTIGMANPVTHKANSVRITPLTLIEARFFCQDCLSFR